MQDRYLYIILGEIELHRSCDFVVPESYRTESESGAIKIRTKTAAKFFFLRD